MRNVGIICGGFSSEFDISVKSAKNIFNNFPSEYRPFLIILRKDSWFVENKDGTIMNIDSREFSFEIDKEFIKIDLAIVFIHGDPGENGKVQSYLEMIGIPYLNSRPLASQLSFNKWYCNQFLRGFGFNVAKSIYLNNSSSQVDLDRIINDLGLPLFVKPSDSGSSFGIYKVNKIEDLNNAIKNAFNESSNVVLESFLDGVEITCGVYRENNEVKTLPLTEIISSNEFFDYEAKYKGLSEEITPARISKQVAKKIEGITSEIYNLMQLRLFARVDFIIVDGVPYVIEVNSIPGFSDESIFPKMLDVAGISIKNFLVSQIKENLN